MYLFRDGNSILSVLNVSFHHEFFLRGNYVFFRCKIVLFPLFVQRGARWRQGLFLCTAWLIMKITYFSGVGT